MIADVSSKSLAELLSLKGRTAVITGAASGIGLATARRFAEAGANVVVADLNEVAGQRAVEQLKAYGGDPSFARLDVRDLDSIVQTADYAVQRYGALHVWANIAGIYPVQRTLDVTPAQWDQVLDINLKGTFFAGREAARRMMGQPAGGVILNTSSTTAHKVPASGMTHYIASKSGIEALTRSLAHEFGPHNIRVLAVSPTMTETDGLDQQQADLNQAAGSPDIHAAYAAGLPLRRLARPDDIARIFLLLASDAAILMTGSTVQVDAGDLTC